MLPTAINKGEVLAQANLAAGDEVTPAADASVRKKKVCSICNGPLHLSL